MKRIRISLAMQILIGLIVGVIVGAIFYGNTNIGGILQPIGATFINLIKMIIMPIIVSTLITGIAGLGGIKRVGKLGLKTILYFEAVTTFALIIGLLIANIVHPGAGVNLQHLSSTDISSYTGSAKVVESMGIWDIIYNIVPTNFFDSLAKGDILPVIFFSIFFGLGITSLGEKGEILVRFFESVSHVMFWITNQIMKLAPIGVFALIGVTVANFGLSSLIPLGKLVITIYVAMALFVVIVLGGILKFCGISLITLVKVLKDEILLAYSTASSETVLPKLMEKMKGLGCSEGVSFFVIPVGYSFNLDGAALYQSLAALFVAQLYGVDMSLEKQIMVLLILMLTSKGAAGVPGASLAVLIATLGSVGIPLEGIAFIAGIDRIIDMGRTLVNVMGNSVAAIVMAKWEKQFDKKKSLNYIHHVIGHDKAV